MKDMFTTTMYLTVKQFAVGDERQRQN